MIRDYVDGMKYDSIEGRVSIEDGNVKSMTMRMRGNEDMLGKVKAS